MLITSIFWNEDPRFLVTQVVSDGAGFKPSLLDSKYQAVPSTPGAVPGWGHVMRTAPFPLGRAPSPLMCTSPDTFPHASLLPPGLRPASQ